MNRSILIIGIDGGTWQILKPAIDKGYMPFLKSMTENGASGTLKSVIPAITPAAWGSFQTGKNPGQTGVYDFWKWDNNTHLSHLVNSNDLNNTIWQLATSAGKTVGTINVPMTYPPKSDSGEIISGILTPSMDSNFTWPPELKQEILNHLPEYKILNFDNTKISPSELGIDNFIELMRLNLEHQYNVAKHLFSKKQYDLFMIHYHATDILQHRMWNYIDESHPQYDPKIQLKVFRGFYQPLDNYIKQTINLSGNSKQITFIVSDHGFQSHYNQFNMAVWLKNKGYIDNEYLEYRRNRINPPKSKINKAILVVKRIGLGKHIRKILPEKLTKRTEVFLGLKTLEHTYKRNSSIHCSSSCRECFITVTNTENKDELLQKLKNEILSIKDSSNNNIVSSVYLKDEIYYGDKIKHMPDITVVPIDNWSFTFKPDQKSQYIDITKNNFHQGTHHVDGIFIASGEGVKKGAKTNFNLLDIAPTVIWLLNLNCDKICFDGSLIQEIWSDNFYVEISNTQKNNIDNASSHNTDNILTQNDVDCIEKRLADLGYM
ncbi:MAG: alkaline phosphatase family protein [Sedimentisphaerales bacterium]|nr:alkaline phosphatase family protein [Sedimentisphaerales bacterium]